MRTWWSAILALTAAGCGVAEPGTTRSPGPTTRTTSASTATVEVGIDNFTFQPAELTVRPGTKVVWINRDDVPHTATSSDKPRAFDSGALDTDGSFAHVFTQPGTYKYFCAVHPKMVGTVIVK